MLLFLLYRFGWFSFSLSCFVQCKLRYTFSIPEKYLRNAQHRFVDELQRLANTEIGFYRQFSFYFWYAHKNNCRKWYSTMRLFLKHLFFDWLFFSLQKISNGFLVVYFLQLKNGEHHRTEIRSLLLNMTIEIGKSNWSIWNAIVKVSVIDHGNPRRRKKITKYQRVSAFESHSVRPLVYIWYYILVDELFMPAFV